MSDVCKKIILKEIRTKSDGHEYPNKKKVPQETSRIAKSFLESALFSKVAFMTNLDDNYGAP